MSIYCMTYSEELFKYHLIGTYTKYLEISIF